MSYASVDMSCYEQAHSAYPSDRDGDGSVNGSSLAQLLGDWGECLG